MMMVRKKKIKMHKSEVLEKPIKFEAKIIQVRIKEIEALLVENQVLMKKIK
jgi:hypothetical protein